MEGIEMGTNIVQKQRLSFFYKMLTVIACFASFGAWFLVQINDDVLHVLILFLYLVFAILCPQYYKYERKTIIWFLLLLLAILATNIRSNFNGLLNSVFTIVPFLFVFNLKSELKSELLYALLITLGVTMFFSMVWWMLYLIGVPLPHSYYSVGDYYEYENYFFFIRNMKWSFLEMLPIPRYCFIFYEPGYLGCLIALLLYVYSYDFKGVKVLYILLVALILSFSLAGWLIALLGFIFRRLKASKNRTGWLSFFTVFMVAFVLFFKSYNGGDNIINLAVLQRMEMSDESDALISGYNRSSESLRDYFWTDFVHSKHALFGRPDATRFFDNDETLVTDWFSYVIRYGWFGLALFIFFVFYPPFAYRKNKFDLTVFSGLFLLIFSQTIFLIYGYMYLTVFSMGCNEIKE